MTLALAQAAAGELRTALLDHGVRQVSLELQPGVSSSGWYCSTFKRGLGHHIASRPSQGLTPGLAVVKRGRPDLKGPLANGYGGFDLVARIITMGWANHPGEGGPWTVPGWGTVPLNNGRPYIFGWEFEGGFEPYTDEMHGFMARCGAGTLDWLGWFNHREPAPLECWDEHKGWAPRRKTDRIGYTTASGRQRIAAVRNAPNPSEEDDMPQVISTSVAPGQEAVVNIAPSGAVGEPAGKAGWGQAWLSVVVDTFDKPRTDVKVRLAIMDGNGAYRPMFGKDMVTSLKPGKRHVVTARPGDCALVVTAYDHPVGVCVEYAKA